MAQRGMAVRRFGIESSGFPIHQGIIGASLDAMMTEPSKEFSSGADPRTAAVAAACPANP
jgi:hypothetical protein